MKLTILFCLSMLLIACKSKNDNIVSVAESKGVQVKNFKYDPEKSPLLFIDVMVNDKYPAVLC